MEAFSVMDFGAVSIVSSEPAPSNRSMFHLGFGRSLSTLAISCMGLLLSCTGEPPPLTVPYSGNSVNREPLPNDVMSALWRVQGEKIVDGKGASVHLRGIAFGNQVWDHVEIPSEHHAGIDFERVKKMGMNSVRFYLSYRTFEDDDAPGEYKQSG